MDFIRPIARYILEPISALRERSSHLRILKELEKSQYVSSGELHDSQLERLRKLLIHANRNCPFYSRRFSEADFNPECLSDLSEISKIPMLTKSDIQNFREEIRAKNYPDEMLVPNQTGGSTGSPLKFYVDRERLFSRKASTYRHDRWAGWDIGRRIGVLWGNVIDFSINPGIKARLREFLLHRRIILDTSSLTRDKMAKFSGRLLAFRPEIYLAYANSIYLFARYLKELNVSDYHKPRAIICSAEVLTEEHRKLIEEVFECPVFNRYGCRETSVIASECSRHEGLHICAETLLVEIIGDGKPCRPGELGNVIVTDLLNYGMPFIRYRIEDLGILSSKACSCGRGLPLMKVPSGRVTDFVVTPEGNVISGVVVATYLVAHAPGISQVQLIQDDLKHVVLKIVKGTAFTDASMGYFAREIPKYLGTNMNFDIEYVDVISKDPSGKFRFSISEIDPMEYLA